MAQSIDTKPDTFEAALSDPAIVSLIIVGGVAVFAIAAVCLLSALFIGSRLKARAHAPFASMDVEAGPRGQKPDPKATAQPGE